MTRILPWVLALGMLAGNACAQLRATPVTVSDVAYELEGYSVLPPQGNNWFELKRDPQSVFFGKKIASRTHAFIATAMSALISENFESPEAFREYISRVLPLRGDGRHRVIENRVEVNNGPGRFCIKYHTRAEDRGAPHAKGIALSAETFGVTCLHPDNPQLNISVSYTERGNPSETSAEFRAEGERFVRSLKFTSYRP
ncbi:MAG: hypothetical protein Q8O70_04810 [Burkholderiales bacterium]|nr:hypothetical protein [Burkholderiales bacterium]